MIARPHTLIEMCTDVNAVPHAGLGYYFLRVQVRNLKRSGGPSSFKWPTKSCLPSALALYGNSKLLQVRPAGQAGYPTRLHSFVRHGLQSGAVSPCKKLKPEEATSQSDTIPVISRGTHTHT